MLGALLLNETIIIVFLLLLMVCSVEAENYCEPRVDHFILPYAFTREATIVFDIEGGVSPGSIQNRKDSCGYDVKFNKHGYILLSPEFSEDEHASGLVVMVTKDSASTKLLTYKIDTNDLGYVFTHVTNINSGYYCKKLPRKSISRQQYSVNKSNKQPSPINTYNIYGRKLKLLFYKQLDAINDAKYKVGE